uniref:TorS_1 protein n=1 Tax=Escherichia coli TaxID=562 RepID=A0A5Q4ZZ25_ECOLX|nr:torS_1 [Escherichia coli]
MADIIKQHALPLLDEIDIARASQDNEKIKRAAHQLKSSCSSLECVAPASNAHNWSSSHYLPPFHTKKYTQCCRSGSMVNKKDLNAI